MDLIAHRGFAADAPENTLRAVEWAAARADAIEIDVRRCGSGELVVVHDETVDRVSDGSGRVADHTLAELRALDVLGTGEGVPSLADLLAAIPPSVGVNVELKESGTAADALALLAADHPQTVVSSYLTDVLAAGRDVDPAMPTALITEEPGTGSVETAADLGCENLHVWTERCDDRVVRAAHDAGLGVNAWTVTDPSEAAAMADVGVDGVIADRADVLPERTG